jgi:anti-sigma regulatory factor (Ser/Thr protein kinase)
MHCLPITEASHVAAARRLVTKLAHTLGLNETEVGKAALITTEAVTNLVKHATSGQLLVRQLPDVGGLELLALDIGPGMRSVQECLRDGYSTAGSPGTGLGAITRLATHWDIYSMQGRGTALYMQLLPSATSVSVSAKLNVGVVCVPKAGEEVCGDAWAIVHQADYSLVMVADGLGHGPQAAEAANTAARLLYAHPTESPVALLERMHNSLRHTRGAAIAIAEVHYERQEVTFAGVGNIAGTIVTAETTRHLMSYNGTVGHQVRKVQALPYAWSDSGLLILHSDGLGSRWDLKAYPGVMKRHPSLLAGVLYRDFVRGRDDVTVLVAGVASPSPAAGQVS